MGGSTTGLYERYFLHRMSPQPPSGNIDRVVDGKFGGGIISTKSEFDGVFTGRSSAELFPFDPPAAIFKVKSMFASTKFWIRQLNIQEFLRL